MFQATAPGFGVVAFFVGLNNGGAALCRASAINKSPKYFEQILKIPDWFQIVNQFFLAQLQTTGVLSQS